LKRKEDRQVAQKCDVCGKELYAGFLSEAISALEKAAAIEPRSELGINAAMEIKRLQYRKRK
jgi:hypothetical protein